MSFNKKDNKIENIEYYKLFNKPLGKIDNQIIAASRYKYNGSIMTINLT